MKVLILNYLPFIALLLFSACQNPYRQPALSSTGSPSATVNLSDGAYQVNADEFSQYFETRYGLLFQKFSDSPFNGRILTIEKNSTGTEYVASDESWKKGRKHGVSSRWFSNGVKMYERNYDEGKWHGAVTRWWPNGQKMYVRAYRDGIKQGKDATWRSDGTSIDLASDKDAGSSETNQPVGTDSGEASSGTSIDSPDPIVAEPSEPSPSFPPVDPPSPPAVDPTPVDNPPVALPPLPGDDAPGGDLPPLPGDDAPALPPLPGDDAPGGDLPPLPGDDAPALPPLPDLPE